MLRFYYQMDLGRWGEELYWTEKIIIGPVTANVQLTNVAPICFSSTQGQHPMGCLPDELCNSTPKAENTAYSWYPLQEHSIHVRLLLTSACLQTGQECLKLQMVIHNRTPYKPL